MHNTVTTELLNLITPINQLSIGHLLPFFILLLTCNCWAVAQLRQQQQQPFYSSSELVPEETFTHSNLSWSSTILYQLPPSTTMHSILSVHFICLTFFALPSVLWCCWLGSRKGIWPVRNWVVGCWHGYVSGSRCRFAFDPADATATHCLLLQ